MQCEASLTSVSAKLMFRTTRDGQMIINVKFIRHLPEFDFYYSRRDPFNSLEMAEKPCHKYCTRGCNELQMQKYFQNKPVYIFLIHLLRRYIWIYWAICQVNPSRIILSQSFGPLDKCRGWYRFQFDRLSGKRKIYLFPRCPQVN